MFLVVGFLWFARIIISDHKRKAQCKRPRDFATVVGAMRLRPILIAPHGAHSPLHGHFAPAREIIFVAMPEYLVYLFTFTRDGGSAACVFDPITNKPAQVEALDLHTTATSAYHI